tara:strand:+ start:682 stop:1635 length:954 start_codon:yes stop_codon:yes gene_type:complete
MAQPMINVLNFDMNLDGASTGDPTSIGTLFRYIDLAKELSTVNRKLYRQCRRYAIAGIQVIAEEGSSVSFFTANDNWITKNAVKKAFHSWMRMNQKVLKETPSIKPTWHDFKVFLDASHRSNNSHDLRAIPDFGYAPFSKGEWVYSQFVYPQGPTHDVAKESYLHIHGQHINIAGGALGIFDPSQVLSTGIIEAYKESRATVQSEDPEMTSVTDQNPYGSLFDDGETNEDITENLSDFNDAAPYLHNVMPGDANHPALYNAAEIRVQSSETVNMTNGFVAPCGLIKVATNQESGIIRLKVFLVPANNAYGIATEAII